MDFQHELRQALQQRSVSAEKRPAQQFANLELLSQFPKTAIIENLLCRYYTDVHPHFPVAYIPDISRAFSSVWYNSNVPHWSFLALICSTLACAVWCAPENELIELQTLNTADWNDGQSLPKDIMSKRKTSSHHFLNLGAKILELNDYKMNINLDVLRSLLLRDLTHTVFFNDGERANPELWATTNLATSIGLHRAGALYGLEEGVIQQRKAVWTGIQVLSGYQILYCGKPFVPGHNKIDEASGPQVESKNSPTDHGAYWSLQRSTADLTIRVFDAIYSITKPDYSVAEALDGVIQSCLRIPTGDPNLFTVNSFREGTRRIRDLNTWIHHHVLRLLLHRPWAARGFRDETFYASSLQCVTCARRILHGCCSIDWDAHPNAPVYKAHLAGTLVRGGIHALSMILLRMHLEKPRAGDAGTIEDWKADADLFRASLAKCETLARSMPDKIKTSLTTLKNLGRSMGYWSDGTTEDHIQSDQLFATEGNATREPESTILSWKGDGTVSPNWDLQGFGYQDFEQIDWSEFPTGYSDLL
ncbi:uncharacterized protein Z520_04692 [Fonsecaea multimorphosa CBS 102226]|uniref:Transcription factor domain-containing protein n=1 Tax=Fonsecaea multimorphosa CBS 102226 TaxID=1442371 RepID=A0A0D2IQ82_9EURO|nr:uncharacterized protein Z520_04692 [Fonsecaea multimorphosa CBS 102226]KIX99116.1 hypothetical protein Z520_04692 [Fonsecaea multimorphosa CBS 102226]OAL26027.1 hypothetical protein AYO22_04441 [Fonsecaea multimorphosa]